VVEKDFVAIMTAKFLNYPNGYPPNEENTELMNKNRVNSTKEFGISDSGNEDLITPLLNNKDSLTQNNKSGGSMTFNRQNS